MKTASSRNRTDDGTASYKNFCGHIKCSPNDQASTAGCLDCTLELSDEAIAAEAAGAKPPDRARLDMGFYENVSEALWNMDESRMSGSTSSILAPDFPLDSLPDCLDVPLPPLTPDSTASFVEFPGTNSEYMDFTAFRHFLRGIVENAGKDRIILYSEQAGMISPDVIVGDGTQHLPAFIRSGVYWLDICGPSSDEIRMLSEIFHLHSLTVEDLQLEEGLHEKCDVFAKYAFICLQAFECDDANSESLRAVNLFLLAFPNFVITIHREPLNFCNTIAKRIRLLNARMGLTADWVLYAILEDVLDLLSPSVRSIELEVDSIDDLVMVVTGNDQSDMLRRISAARKRVTQLIRLVSAKTEVMRIIVKRCGNRVGDDALLYLRDLQEHISTLEQHLKHHDETLNRSHSNYLAHISIETSQISNRMNQVMKKLTAAASLALPWSILSGLFGMNMIVPGHHFSHNHGSWLPFMVIICTMSLISSVIFYLGRRRDWF